MINSTTVNHWSYNSIKEGFDYNMAKRMERIVFARTSRTNWEFPIRGWEYHKNVEHWWD